MPVARRYPRDIPPLWLGLALTAMALLHKFLPVTTLLAPPWNRVGHLVIAASVLVLLASAWRFKRAGTPVRPFREGGQLIVRGAYHYSRNPMYAGLLGAAAGMAICLGTAAPLVVPPLLFWVLDQRFVRREETFLRQRFGAAYDSYCARVRRWL